MRVAKSIAMATIVAKKIDRVGSPIRRENEISLLRRHCENQRSHAITGLSPLATIPAVSEPPESSAAERAKEVDVQIHA